MAWTDEKRQQAIEMYLAENPTPETSMEIVKTIAEELEEAVNGVRMILTKSGHYVKKVAAEKASGSSSESSGNKRVGKEEAQNSLKAAITDAGGEVDEDIISKLTGKAAIYLAAVINGTKD